MPRCRSAGYDPPLVINSNVTSALLRVLDNDDVTEDVTDVPSLSWRRPMALHLLDRLERDEKDFAEVEALKSSSPATARPKVRQHITRSILTALDDLEEDLSRECRERGQVLRKVIELLHHGVDAQLSMLEGEKQELQGEVRGLVKEVTSLGAKADLARAAAVRAKIIEAGLRSRLAESRDEIDRLYAENDVLKADVRSARARTESAGAGPLESSGRAWFSALGELLEGSAAEPGVLGSLTSGLPAELAEAVRLLAAHSSMVHGELTLSRVAVRDIMALPQLSDEEVQASSFLSSCDGEVQTIVGAVMEVAVGTESPYPQVDSAIQVGYSTDESESEASSPTPSEFDSEGDDEAVEEGDLEAAELLSSDFAKLIDPSLSGLEMSKGASKKAGVWSHTDLHSTIDRLYDALPGRFKATGERLKSVALSIMASLRQQHGIPSVVMKRAWQLLRSLIYWKSPPGHGSCITCSTFVKVLLGKVTFSDFRIMLYFRRLMRRRSKLKHDLRSFGVRRPESAVAMSLTHELFSDGMVVDDIVTAITAGQAGPRA
ncbi:hypothetical protein Pmar_PMAR023619 [Perkinsus marinus ATCC 50983]|uniref:Uncharacterized protein n=1 Tax=Perkinsus marinus (strain ATCC 50983 / TXsc) TaxID=423536 RepID=C5KCU9_PERM5|nr:hypothetical protein Pmar_PMAR023619 [Perkinsus marinus ATCC 50983]EER17698.1 hypothetical protein Pmar_PMAR023619 [Perkinsus marinus ATCC 50983]|eukprot:XP_002785902.1 hypothetical protein Pmar_PMAR023619 [Perkinsus marinus ATCC 50983]